MSRETLCCVFQVFSFGMDPLFWVCQKAKIWSPCMVGPELNYRDVFSYSLGDLRVSFLGRNYVSVLSESNQIS